MSKVRPYTTSPTAHARGKAAASVRRAQASKAALPARAKQAAAKPHSARPPKPAAKPAPKQVAKPVAKPAPKKAAKPVAKKPAKPVPKAAPKAAAKAAPKAAPKVAASKAAPKAAAPKAAPKAAAPKAARKAAPKAPPAAAPVAPPEREPKAISKAAARRAAKADASTKRVTRMGSHESHRVPLVAAGVPASTVPGGTAPGAAPGSLSCEQLMLRVVELARERRAMDVVALDVRGLVDYMDFLVLATGRGDRQNRAIADGVLRGLRGLKVRPLVRPGPEDGAWICLDFVDVVFHVFDGATRAHYDLELLWGDAPKVDLPAAVPLPQEGDEALRLASPQATADVGTPGSDLDDDIGGDLEEDADAEGDDEGDAGG